MTQPQPTTPLSRPEALTLGGLAAVKVAVHLASTPGYGIFRDEYYYLACARHLAWGYVDHPPLSIALLALLTGLFGDSVWTLRIPMALLGALTVVLTGLIARRLGGGLFAVALAGLAALVAPTLLGMSAFYSMNSLDLFFWACAVYVLAGILREDRPQGWLLFGLIAGLGLMNKFSMAFLGFGVVAGLLLTPHRKHFLDWHLYAGGAIAVVLYLPNLWWQVTHDFAMFEFMRNASSFKNAPISPLQFFLGQVLEFHPLNALLCIAGLGFAAFHPAGRAWRFIAVAFAAIFLVFAFTNGKIYYLAPAYALAYPLGALALERFTAGRTRARAAVLCLLAGTGLILLPLALPLLPPSTTQDYLAFVGLGPRTGERNAGGAPLPQHLSDRFGWPEMAGFFAKAYDALPEAQRQRCQILVGNYGEAGALEYHGAALGLPMPLCAHNNYYYWGLGATGSDTMLVFSGIPPEKLGEYFEQVTEVGRFDHPFAMPYETDKPLYLCEGLKQPLTDVWPQLRRFI